ncbi:MAG: hypothetical protein KC656_35545, partial [Myxococcales bacterium]|nr:hypothetical protein [Myxococcales bacterium]
RQDNPFTTRWKHITDAASAIYDRPDAPELCDEPPFLTLQRGTLSGPDGTFDVASRATWVNAESEAAFLVSLIVNQPSQSASATPTKAWMLETLGIPDDRYAIGLELTDEAARLIIGNVDGDIAREEPAFLGDVSFTPLAP